MKRKKGDLSVFVYKLPNVVRISLYSCGKRIESYDMYKTRKQFKDSFDLDFSPARPYPKSA